MTGFEKYSTTVLQQIRDNLNAGIDRVLAQQQAGNLEKRAKDGLATPKEAGETTQMLLDALDKVLESRGELPLEPVATLAEIDAVIQDEMEGVADHKGVIFQLLNEGIRTEEAAHMPGAEARKWLTDRGLGHEEANRLIVKVIGERRAARHGES